MPKLEFNFYEMEPWKNRLQPRFQFLRFITGDDVRFYWQNKCFQFNSRFQWNTDNNSVVKNVTFKEPTFGDHVLIIAELELANNFQNKVIFKRDWKNYSPENLCSNLRLSDLMFDICVQSKWNYIKIERLSGAQYCISQPANGCSSYTHISYHDIVSGPH